VPYWTCDTCNARLYSASEALRWKECPVCEGSLMLLDSEPLELGATRIASGEAQAPQPGAKAPGPEGS
jgi:hypothetical protein